MIVSWRKKKKIQRRCRHAQVRCEALRNVIMSNQRILHCCLLQGSLHAGRRQCPMESQHQMHQAHKSVGPEWDCALRGNIDGMCKPRKGCSEFDDLSLALVAVADVCARPWSAFAVMIGRRGEARSVALSVARLLGERISSATISALQIPSPLNARQARTLLVHRRSPANATTPAHSSRSPTRSIQYANMSAQNTNTTMSGGDATLDKGKGKAAEPTREDVTMGEEDSSDEESGVEDQVRLHRLPLQPMRDC